MGLFMIFKSFNFHNNFKIYFEFQNFQFNKFIKNLEIYLLFVYVFNQEQGCQILSAKNISVFSLLKQAMILSELVR